MSLPIPIQIALGVAIAVLTGVAVYLEYCEWRQRRHKKDVDSW